MFEVFTKLVFAFVIACSVAVAAGAISRVAVPVNIPKDKAYVIDTSSLIKASSSAESKSSYGGISSDMTEVNDGGNTDKVLSFAELLAAADEKRGQKVAKACAACHSFDKGGRTKMGPNLWGVVGRDVASMEGFNYSDAMKAKGGKWGYDELNEFITKPRAVVKGTKMSFSGIKKAEDRAALIKWLRSLSDDPYPLP